MGKIYTTDDKVFKPTYRKDDEGITVLGQQIQYLRAKHDEDDLQHAYADHDRQSRHDAVD